MTRTSPVQTAFSSGELSPLLYGRTDYTRFQTGLRTCNGFIPLRQGGFTRAPGTIFEGATRSGRRARLMAFEFAVDDSMILEVTANDVGQGEAPGGTVRFWRYGTPVLKDGVPYQLAIPYSQLAIDRMQWVQSADVIYIVDGTLPIQRLQRRALDDWSIAELLPTDGPFRVGNVDKEVTVQVKAPDAGPGVTTDYLFTAVGDAVDIYATGDVFTAQQVGSLFQVETFESGDLRLWTSNVNYAAGAVVRSGANYYRSLNANDSKDTPPTHDEGVEGSNANLWEYLSDSRGVMRITSVVDANHARGEVVRPIPLPCTVKPTYRWAESAWSDKNGYPGSIAIYNQRLVAAATPTDPRTIWFSTVGSFTEFGGDSEDDQAFAYSVDGGTSLNRIIWLQPGRRGLHVGALGQEFSVRSNDAGRVIGPTTFELGADSSIGSHKARPIAPDGKPIFISKDRRRVYEMRYAFEEDANRPVELSLPAEHLGSRGFEDIAWQAAEQRIAWLRLSDGTLALLVHDPQEDVLGWARLTVAGGFVESIASYSNPTTNRDILTMQVRRTVDGVQKRFMERLAPVFGLLNDTPAGAHHFFCAVSFGPGAPTDTFSVPHLAGQEVMAWTDEGSTGPLKVAAGGAVILPFDVSRATIGLFDATHEVETLPVQAASRDGDTTGRQLRLLPGHGIRLHRTAGGTIATVERDPERGAFTHEHEPLVPTAIGTEQQELFSGVTDIQAASGKAKEVSFAIRPEGGAPLTVLTLTSMIDEAGG